MADLNTFDDRTIQKARDKFTDGKRGSGDDPIATHAKIAQDTMLGNLEVLLSRAEEKASATSAGLQGELDGDALIDPFLSYDENVAQIQREYGVNFETYARAERESEVADADDKAKRHAREALRDNFEAIESGERPQLVQDIREEFGDAFVAGVLGRERDIEATEPAGAPEPTEPAEATTADGFEPIERPEPATAEQPAEGAIGPASAQAELSEAASAAAESESVAEPAGAPESAQPSAPAAVMGALAIVLQSVASKTTTGLQAVAGAVFLVFRESRGDSLEVPQ